MQNRYSPVRIRVAPPFIFHMPLNTAKLKEKIQFTSDVFELTFETPTTFNFEAGQFVTIKIADKTPPCFRAYSISSTPHENGNIFSTCLKIIEGGRGSNWLNNLKPGDPIEFLGPNGKFTFKGEKQKSLFVATGTGITPFNSIISDQLNKGNTNPIQLLFGLRHIENIFYQDFFESLAKKHPNFSYDITLSQPENNSWAGKTGRVTDTLKTMEIDTANTEIYICGLKAMIDEVLIILKEKSVPEKNIYFEKFD